MSDIGAYTSLVHRAVAKMNTELDTLSQLNRNSSYITSHSAQLIHQLCVTLGSFESFFPLTAVSVSIALTTYTELIAFYDENVKLTLGQLSTDLLICALNVTSVAKSARAIAKAGATSQNLYANSAAERANAVLDKLDAMGAPLSRMLKNDMMQAMSHNIERVCTDAKMYLASCHPQHLISNSQGEIQKPYFSRSVIGTFMEGVESTTLSNLQSYIGVNPAIVTTYGHRHPSTLKAIAPAFVADQVSTFGEGEDKVGAVVTGDFVAAESEVLVASARVGTAKSANSALIVVKCEVSLLSTTYEPDTVSGELTIQAKVAAGSLSQETFSSAVAVSDGVGTATFVIPVPDLSFNVDFYILKSTIVSGGNAVLHLGFEFEGGETNAIGVHNPTFYNYLNQETDVVGRSIASIFNTVLAVPGDLDLLIDRKFDYSLYPSWRTLIDVLMSPEFDYSSRVVNVLNTKSGFNFTSEQWREYLGGGLNAWILYKGKRTMTYSSFYEFISSIVNLFTGSLRADPNAQERWNLVMDQ
jgi:hypothetical protein